jgi:hypothetical protein
MKKTFTHSFLLAICFSFFASCDKEATAPAKVAASTTSRTTNTVPQTTANQNQGHTCGGGSYTDHYNGGY